MTWAFGDRHVSNVSIVDDLEEGRDSFELLVVDSELNPINHGGPFGDLANAFERVSEDADAAICDHELRGKRYATFQGAELVAESVSRGFPAILCTRWIGPDIDTIRPFLDRIPVLLRPDQLNEPNELHDALKACIQEISGELRPDRKSWRTQVFVERIDEDDANVAFVSLPAWGIDEVVRLRLDQLPEQVAEEFVEGFRCHAHTNLGAESPDLLYFHGWEAPG